MKIITECASILHLDDYLEVDGLIVNTVFSISTSPIYQDNDLLVIASWAKEHQKELIYRIDKIMSEDDLPLLLDFINHHLESSFFYSDFAIFTYFKSLNRLNQLYYVAQTYLVNQYDVSFYTSQGIKCLISNELQKEEIETILLYNQKNKTNLVGVLAYGFFPIYYTKRPLLSLYQTKCQENQEEVSIPKLPYYDLKEELREDHYKISELKNGTIISSCHKMMMDESNLNLRDFYFIYISSAYLSDEEIKKVITYYAYIRDNDSSIDNPISKKEFSDCFKSFLYKKNEIL